jgi:hypothetical protein
MRSRSGPPSHIHASTTLPPHISSQPTTPCGTPEPSLLPAESRLFDRALAEALRCEPIPAAAADVASRAHPSACLPSRGPQRLRLLQSACGPTAWWQPPEPLLSAAARLAAAVGLTDLASSLAPPQPSAVLLLFRPTPDGSSWFRGGSPLHMRNGRCAARGPPAAVPRPTTSVCS